jgi:CBS domain-containing protein
MKARDLMTTPVITVRPETTLKAAATLLWEHRVSGLPVVDADGNLVGMVSEAAPERG